MLIMLGTRAVAVKRVQPTIIRTRLKKHKDKKQERNIKNEEIV